MRRSVSCGRCKCACFEKNGAFIESVVVSGFGFLYSSIVFVIILSMAWTVVVFFVRRFWVGGAE